MERDPFPPNKNKVKSDGGRHLRLTSRRQGGKKGREGERKGGGRTGRREGGQSKRGKENKTKRK